MTIRQEIIRNRLLKALPPDVFATFLPHMRFMDLPARHVLVQADEPTTEVCFIESGLASVVAATIEDESIEVGHVGHEGMAGTHILLTVDQTPNKTFMQVEGRGVQIPVQPFIELLSSEPNVRNFLLRYLHTTDLQLAHSALANARYNMHERLARWLLMCHDRLNGPDLPLTHEFLSLMLGVRRSGVTNELHVLEGIHAIKATRGNVRIVNREKLLEIAGGCYGTPEREYERVMDLAFVGFL